MSRGYWQRGWPAVRAILTVLLLASITPVALAGAVEERMEARIWDLRVTARYEEAVAVADSLVAVLQSDPDLAAYRLVDARILAGTVRLAASLPEANQQELARADSLSDAVSSRVDHRASIEAAEKQLEIRRRLLGDSHPDVAASLEAIGQHAAWIDEVDTSRRSLDEALEIALESYGSEHPRTAQIISELGFAHRWTGNYAKAESLYLAADAMRRPILGDRDPDTLWWETRLGWLKLDLGEYQEAERILRQAWVALKEVLGAEDEMTVGSMENLALSLLWLERYPEADAMYQDLFELHGKIRENGEPPPNVIHCYALLRSRWGDAVTADRLYGQTIAAYEREYGPDHPRIGETMLDRVEVLRQLGRYDEAIAVCEEVEVRWPDDLQNRALVSIWRASVYGDRGDLRAQLRYGREALAAQEALAGPDHPWTVWFAQNLARSIYGSGDMVAAEAMAREALERQIAIYGEQHTAVAGARQLLSGIYLSRGDFERAKSEAMAVLEINQVIYAAEHLGIASSLSWLATVSMRSGDDAAALEYAEQALAVAERVSGDSPETMADYLTILARVHLKRQEYDLTEPLVRRALDIRERAFGENSVHYATNLGQLSSCLWVKGDLDGAMEYVTRMLPIIRETAGAFDSRLVQPLIQLGRLCYDRGDYEGAESYLLAGAEVYDLARVKVGSGMERAAFAGLSPYARLALSQVELGEHDKAWQSAERTSARALADLLADAERRTLTPSEAAREDSIRSLIVGLERRVEAYRQTAGIDSTAVTTEDIEVVERDLAAAETAWSVFRREMAERHPESEGRVADLAEVQSALGPATALIGWLDVEQIDGTTESCVYVVRDRGSVAWARLEDTGPDAPSPGAAARAIRDAIADPSAPLIGIARETRSLWQQRFAPVAEALDGVRNLVVVPSGPLLGVPVEALVLDDGRFAGEVYEVSYSPSATVYSRLGGGELAQVDTERSLFVGDPPFVEAHVAAMASEPESPWELLAMAEAEGADASVFRGAVAGNDAALSGLPRLRGTRAEVGLLKEMSAGADVLLGPDASEQELVSLAQSGKLSGYRTLHIATHALVDDERPEQSALVLSQVGLPDALDAAMRGERIYDGLLTAKEIVGECDLDADLVTLSACETGLGREMVGEGYVGFAHAFLQAGARSLVVSLWKVDDRATALLMQRFYENRSGYFTDERDGRVAEPLSKAEALAEAKAWLRAYADDAGHSPYEHPYYWSAFVLIGDRS